MSSSTKQEKINDNRTIDSDQVIYVQIVLSSMNNSPSYS